MMAGVRRRATAAAIDVQDLRIRFGGRTVLDGVSFGAPAGSVTGFVGVNGAGKTTTLRRLLALEHGEGDALIGGADYRDLEDPLRSIGFCPDALGAPAGSTAREHLRAIATRAGVDAVERTLREVGLADVTQRIRTYSLGMRRRLAIAGALVASPPVLVMDEPFDGLDPEGRRWLGERLRAHADAGGVVLLSAHALDEIEPLLDRLVCLHAGRVRFEGAAERFLQAHAAPVTIVRSLDQQRLAVALRSAGATVAGRAAGAVAVRGLAAAQIAEVAAAAQVLVTELSPRRVSLSQAFATMTSEAG
ncbi:ATP-binding cassette domain-containing protein [Agrococcus sp. ARC_14]|uniref:ABC transporter ATP-binding protein n=1 Tax=Agrococcus sp. ARC_14 TaxID=2919927 RepID=UPI001F059095|nr:ATP-binding cassette domain-containing protein [Agrococcus sp. ARC_14]MCH1884198.1 ATP-binding cassette domain-containing protein [Agrococcus sp. ARC_14]